MIFFVERSIFHRQPSVFLKMDRSGYILRANSSKLVGNPNIKLFKIPELFLMASTLVFDESNFLAISPRYHKCVDQRQSELLVGPYPSQSAYQSAVHLGAKFHF